MITGRRVRLSVALTGLVLFGCSADHRPPGDEDDWSEDDGHTKASKEKRAGTSTTNAVYSAQWSNPSIPGAAVLEGDMVFPGKAGQGIAASTTSGVVRWPNGVIPYVIDPALPKPERVTEAAEHWQKMTGIRFIPRTNEADYVNFFNGEGCYSALGKVGGKQDISILWSDKGVCPVGAVIHEIGHTVGLAHEQSRFDRDDYVTIHFENIDADKVSQFDKTNFQAIGEYDITSIMQYDSTAFSNNGKPSMTDKSDNVIPRTEVLSAKDVAGVLELYAKELKGDNTDTGAPKSVALTWPMKSNTATYSLDVQRADDSWIAPCVNSATIKRGLSMMFDGRCPSGTSKSVNMQTIKAFRICWAENEDWVHATCTAVPYLNQTSLAIGQ
jgi:hypothetical protein